MTIKPLPDSLINGIAGFISFLIFRIILDICYVNFVSELYSSSGFDLTLNFVKLVESYIWLVLTYVVLPKDQSKLSSIIIHVFVLVAYIPLQSYYALANQDRSWFYMATFFWFLIIWLNRANVKFGVHQLSKGNFKYLVAICGLFVFLVSILLYSYINVSLNLDFNNVYEIRESYSEKNIPLSDYLFSWAGQIVLPFLALVALFSVRRKSYYFLIVAVSFMVLILFSATGHKTFLFRWLAALGLAYMLIQPFFVKRLTNIFSLMLISGLALSIFLHHHMFGAIFIKRLFYSPVLLSYHYFDFFQNKAIMLSHSIFKYFISYPYDLPPRYLIGSIYMDDPERSSNNGVMADAFMNFGYVGLIIWPVIITLMLKLADEISSGKNKFIIWPLIILSFSTMINASLLTSIVTHGLLVTFLISLYYPREQVLK